MTLQEGFIMENIEKEFKFGYGKIVVATYGIYLELTVIDPPLKIGTVVDDELEKYDSNNMVKNNDSFNI